VINQLRQRDLVLLLVACLAVGVVAVSTRIPSGASSGSSATTEPQASVAAAVAAASSSTVQPPSVDALPADTRAEFDALPAGTVLVACNSSVATYPDGIYPVIAPAWRMAHPAFQVLVHGYCVDNPSKIVKFSPQPVP
jgi:hypothetical protein